MHGVSLGTIGLGSLLAVLLNVLVERRLRREEQQQKQPHDNAGFDNHAALGDEDAASQRSFNTKF